MISIAVIIFSGIACLSIDWDHKNKFFGPLLFPMGVALATFVHLLGLLMKIKATNYFLISGVLALIGLNLLKRKLNFAKNILLPFLITGVLYCIVYFFNNIIFTYDSFKLYALGSNLFNQFNIFAIADQLSSWGYGGIFPAYFFESFSEQAHLNKFFHFVFFANAYLIFSIFTFFHPTKQKNALLLGIGFLVVYFTMPMLIRSNGYIHNNALTGLFLLSVVYCYLMKLPKSFLISIIAFSLMRVELPLICAAILFVFLDRFTRKEQRWILGLCYLAILAWNLFVMANSPEENSISSAKKHLFMLVVTSFGFVCAYLKYFSSKFLKLFENTRLELFLGFGFTLFMLFPILKTQTHLQISTSNLLRNVFSMENYASSLFFVVLFFATYFQKSIRKEILNIRFFTLFYFIAIILFSIFRTPYRIMSWGDSANRMMLQLMPLILIIAMTALFQLLSNKKTLQTGEGLD